MRYEKPIIFVVGVAIGAGVAILATKSYFETISNDEIESVKKAYKTPNTPHDDEKLQDFVNAVKTQNTRVSVDDKAIYEQHINHFGYDVVSNKKSKEEIETKLAEKEGPSDEKSKPYHISIDDFTENKPYYKQVTVTYFPKEQLLVDDISGEFEDVESTVGKDNMSLFLETDEDVIYIRNDNLSIDYEVVKSNAEYDPMTNGYRIY